MIAEFIEMNRRGRRCRECRTGHHNAHSIAELAYKRPHTRKHLQAGEPSGASCRGVKEFIANKTEEGSESLSLVDFLSEVSLATDQDSDEVSEERITLMTVHAAKALNLTMCSL